LIPELIGRLPVLTYLEPLTKEVLIRIFKEPKNALLKQYQKLFELEGIQLEVEEEAIILIAEKALEFKLGARGLRSICEEILTDAMFSLPSEEGVTEFTVTREYADAQLFKSKLSKLKVA
jgi:ATP-dependent Clp protease ATP-binding subunit ClpX